MEFLSISLILLLVRLIINQLYIMFMLEINFNFKLVIDIFDKFIIFNQIVGYNLYNNNFLIINFSFLLLSSTNELHEFY